MTGTPPGGRIRAWLRPTISRLIGGLARLSRLRGPTGIPMRILIVAYEPELGSIMAMTPMLGALRVAQPEASITVAGRPLLTEALHHDPYIDRLAEIRPAGRSGGITLWDCARALAKRGQSYDWVVVTEGNRHHVRTGLLSLCIRAARRSGLAASTVLAHYDHPVAFDPTVSMVVNNLRALMPLGVQPHQREPEIHFDQAALDAAHALLAHAGLDPARPIAVFATQASGRQPVSWPAERFAAVADRLSSEAGLQAVFVGTGQGRESIAGILSRMETAGVSLCGLTTVPVLAAVCAIVDLMVTIDTGALHVARGVGTPTVLVASGWQSPHHWLPQGIATCTILCQAELCRPACRTGVCATPACMAAVEADAVLEAARDMLARFPPLAGRRARIASRLSLHGPVVNSVQRVENVARRA